MFFTKFKNAIDLKVEEVKRGLFVLSENYEKKFDAIRETTSQMNLDLQELVKAMNELKIRSDKIEEVLQDYENFSIEKALAKKSDEPWAGLSITEVDSDTGRVGIKLDWNEKFQDHLKRSGIPGNTDDERMAIWFASLVKELGEEIDEETAQAYTGKLK